MSLGALSPPVATSKPTRVLSCVTCAQRKVKCDRKFPCSNCTRLGLQCVPAATISRQRRRRFPERELLERLHHYEDLLRQHNIAFQPMHPNTATHLPSIDNESENRSNHGQAEERALQPHLNRSEHLLFCSRSAGIELSTLHPPQAQIFKLWQIYLENVDPLLKLTHTPTLQPRIIDAAGDVSSIEPNMEALMFAIYCMSVFSLEQEQCQKMFGTSRIDVIRGYQLGAREALLNCGFLKTEDRECLTALHLYLITLTLETDPRSLASMLATAVRIAQRMGIDSEADNIKHPVLEAELRRRLWWSLVLFDSRIAEKTESRLSTLLPTWDCKVPLSVNDSTLQKDMKTPPIEFEITSEAMFAVTRSQISDFIRHSTFHLDFINPIMKSLAKGSLTAHGSEHDELVAFETRIETKYLARCDAQNPLHFMTILWARVSLAKIRFAHYLSTRGPNPDQETSEERDKGLSYARDMLECDTAIMESSSTKGYRWFMNLHFPFPAYIHLVWDLKQRPLSDDANRAWEVMSANSEARFLGLEHKHSPMVTTPNNPFFSIFAGIVLQAWAAREAISVQSDPPMIVTRVKQQMDHMKERAAAPQCQLWMSEGTSLNAPVLVDQGNFYPLPVHGQHEPMDMSIGSFSVAPTQVPADFGSSQWDWSTHHWGAMFGQGW
ncbi:C6 transcription factor [Pyrenophora seminiperda CCB06]|uniref:C6 transcription factor n=1 Tax=Pyrenophora seminiperda CCB06 TaxID=1302712 RepID=A0A3M7M0Y1_9PLEO|nr:C6 transcription factor [Pyrenophora seminiperda CCB06]